jgi:branched-chain amino acid transport system substrate-binding protein
MTVRRRLLLLFVIGLCSFLVAGCGGDDDEAAPATGTEQTSEPIVLGGAIALSGFEGPWDEVKMIEYALDDINADGGVLGRQLELKVCDTKSDVALGPTCAQEVIDKGAEVVITSCDLDFGGPAATVAQEAGLIGFSECASSTKFGPLGLGELAFTMSQGSNVDAAAMAEYASNELDAQSAYILNDTFLEHKKEVCEQYLPGVWEELGGELVGQDTYSNEDPSVGAQVTRIKSLNPQPDVLFLCATLPGGPAVVRQLREAGVDVPIVTETGGDSPDYNKTVPNLTDYYFQTYGSEAGDDPNPEFNKLSERYLDDTGKRPFNSIVYQIYAMTQVIAQAIERADGKTEGEALKEALESSWEGDPFDTILGEVRFDPNTHHYVGEVGFGTWEGGKRTVQPRFTPEHVPEATAS